MGQDEDLSEDLCGNPSCECHPKSGQDYCSEDCEKNATAPDHVCKCGHEHCPES
jgi:hypothetical protein